MSVSWGSAGTILYSNSRTSLASVPANGGAPVRVLDRTENADGPAFLPDGRHYLIAIHSANPAQAGTFVGTLDGTARIRLVAFPTYAQYADGHLLFVRDTALYAQPFDLPRLQLRGAATQLAENVSSFTVSSHGEIAYLATNSTGTANGAELLWMDRSGRVRERIDQAAGATRPALSPDDRRISMMLRSDV